MRRAGNRSARPKTGTETTGAGEKTKLITTFRLKTINTLKFNFDKYTY